MMIPNKLVFAVALFATFSAIGCTVDPKPNPEADAEPVDANIRDHDTLTKDDILTIAKRELAIRDTWSDRAEFEVERDGDGWSVYIVRLPKTPGGHRFVSIDAAGNVTDYFRGR